MKRSEICMRSIYQIKMSLHAAVVNGDFRKNALFQLSGYSVNGNYRNPQPSDNGFFYGFRTPQLCADIEMGKIYGLFFF